MITVKDIGNREAIVRISAADAEILSLALRINMEIKQKTDMLVAMGYVRVFEGIDVGADKIGLRVLTAPLSDLVPGYGT